MARSARASRGAQGESRRHEPITYREITRRARAAARASRLVIRPSRNRRTYLQTVVWAPVRPQDLAPARAEGGAWPTDQWTLQEPTRTRALAFRVGGVELAWVAGAADGTRSAQAVSDSRS